MDLEKVEQKIIRSSVYFRNKIKKNLCFIDITMDSYENTGQQTYSQLFVQWSHYVTFCYKQLFFCKIALMKKKLKLKTDKCHPDKNKFVIATMILSEKSLKK